MKNGNNKNPGRMAKTVLALLLAAAFALGAASFTACGKAKTDDEKLIEDQKTPGGAGESLELTESQKKTILDAAEAFAEAQEAEGLDMESMTIGDFEKFVYYLYNGELTADESGFGTVASADADARIQSLFGVTKLRHTPRRQGFIQNFYCEGDDYFVRVNEPFGETAVTGAEWTEDGHAKITVSVSTPDGVVISLEFSAELKDGGLIITNCKRYDAI